MGKKHNPYIKILLWLQAHMLNPKLFFHREKKKRGSRKIKTKTPSQTYSNLHIHIFSHIDALVPIYPSKPPSLCLNRLLITTAGTHAPALTQTPFLTHMHVSSPWAVCLSLHSSHDTVMAPQPEDREMFIQSPGRKVQQTDWSYFVLGGLCSTQGYHIILAYPVWPGESIQSLGNAGTMTVPIAFLSCSNSQLFWLSVRTEPGQSTHRRETQGTEFP